jgi:oxygen-independent coproporphyrinogen-3 oxidase
MVDDCGGMYIHIPFCVSKCRYCSFVSVPVRGFADARVEAYLDCLHKEMEGEAKAWTDTRFDSLFIGGGTPSVLTVPEIPKLIEKAQAYFEFAPGSEITVEVNPESFTPEKAFAFAQAGVNRLSFGVQSPVDAELAYLGRPHSWVDAQNAIDYARMAGIDNLSVDLMYGLPGQSVEGFHKSVHSVLVTGVSHLSCYALTLEEGTPLYDAVCSGEVPSPDGDTAADMWEGIPGMARQYGLKRYEISNLAKPGFECRHNLHYWHQQSYAGFGVAAHGAKRTNEGMLRMQNTDDLGQYMQSGPGLSAQTVAGVDAMFEYVMLQTRLAEGFALDDFARRYGHPFMEAFGDAAQRACANGLARLSPDRFLLTEKGLLLQNTVLGWFLP